MPRPRCLAAAQTVPVPGDVDANLAQHLRLARIAAGAGAQVLLFPELSLTGYELALAERLAFDPADPRLAPLLEAAAAGGLVLVAGAPVRIDARLQLGAFVVSPERSVEVYTKQRLGAFPADVNPGGVVPPPEASVFQPGTRAPLVRFGGGHTAAVAICADIGTPAHAEAAAARGAKSYLASMFVIPADLEGDTAKLEACAERHAMSVVFANFGGASGGLPSAGRSAIWSERGERLAALPASGAGVVVAEETSGGWRARTFAA